MSSNGPHTAQCRHCSQPLGGKGKTSGRPRIYCDARCRTAFQRAQKQPSKDTAVHDEHLIEVIDDIRRRVTELVRLTRNRADSHEVLTLITALGRDTEDAAGAAARQARDRKVPWKLIASYTNRSPDAARRTWSRERTDRMRQRRQRTRGQQPPDSTPMSIPLQPRATPRPGNQHGSGMGTVPDGEPPGTDPNKQLARALSYLQRCAGKPLRTLGEEANVSGSYISRILSGERCPSWKVTRQLALSCNADPTDIQPLWQAARAGTCAPRDPMDTTTFHAALRGLHLSAACPDPDTIRDASQGRLNVDDITRLLNGTPHQDWTIVDRFVRALHGRPADIQPLWKEAVTPTPHDTRPTPHTSGPWRAEHFG